MNYHHQPAKPLQLLSHQLSTSFTLKEKKYLPFRFQANQFTRKLLDDSFKSFPDTFSPRDFSRNFSPALDKHMQVVSW